MGILLPVLKYAEQRAIRNTPQLYAQPTGWTTPDATPTPSARPRTS